VNDALFISSPLVIVDFSPFIPARFSLPQIPKEKKPVFGGEKMAWGK